MKIIESGPKSILRKNKKIDSWFISGYGMNLYRGCSHDCSYCDGRAEKYRVQGEFGKEIIVKTNAIELLREELDPDRKRKPFNSGFFLVGGGVCDSYEPLEKKYQLTREALELLHKYNHPAHLLTKSTLIERDIELIKKINRKSRAIVSMSFSSVDDSVSRKFEPGVSPPSDRLNTLRRFKNEGISCGMFLMPVIPFVTDTIEKIAESLKAAKDANLDYVVFGGMTLKAGRQQDHFFRVLENYQQDLVGQYKQIYRGNEWGSASGEYYDKIHRHYSIALKKNPIAGRIPSNIFQSMLDRHQLAIILLEHIDYYLKLIGQKSPYGYGAYQLSKFRKQVDVFSRSELDKINLNNSVNIVLSEILETGRSALYEKLTKEFH